MGMKGVSRFILERSIWRETYEINQKSAVVLGLTLSLLSNAFAQTVTISSSSSNIIKGSKSFSYNTSTLTLLTDSIFNLTSFNLGSSSSSTNAINTLNITLKNSVTNLVTSLFTYNSSSSSSSLFSGLVAQGTYTLLASGTTQSAWSNNKKNLQSFSVNLNATPVTPVPEPETYALISVGLLGLLMARRRKTLEL